MATVVEMPGRTRPQDHDLQLRATRPSEALNVFMADMQAGIGPFQGVALQQRGWSAGPIATATTAGGWRAC